MGRKNIHFLDYLAVIVRWRKFIIVNFIIVCFLTAGISLILPKTYRSYSVILPSMEAQDMLGLGSLFGDLPSAISGLGLPGISAESSSYLAILNSRTVLDSIIIKFDLRQIYKTKTMIETRKRLLKNTSINANDDGTITVAVAAKTKYFSFGDSDVPAKLLSKNIADCYIRQLEIVNSRLRGEKARNNRKFIEKRYYKNIADLEAAEEKMEEFQQKSGAVAIPEQMKAAIEAIARIRGMMVTKEVEVDVLKNYVNPSHPDLQKAESELKELNNKYDQFISKNVYAKSENSKKPKDIFLPFDELPDLGLKYARFYREVMIQQKIQEFLLPLYEQAKIQEAKDTPAVQVLDPPALPEKKEQPKRAILVLTMGFFSLLFSLIFVYISVNIEYMKNENADRYNQLVKIFREIYPFRRQR